MASKKISYAQRDFEGIREELLKFSNKYYPEIFDDFNDSSIGSWFIDLVSDVGDNLNYHIDRMYQETNLDSANLRSTVLNMARTNGLKIPGRKASTCEVEISCELPIDSTNIARPDYAYAPILQRTSIVSAGNYNFELTENVNFATQFNESGYSNRKIVPSRDSNGNITGYTVSKSTIAINGNTKVYKKVIYASDLKPFMEFVLPEENVMNIESIIFKETSDFNNNPSIYEYYIDEEEYKISNEAVMTYRFFECDSLADQYRFGFLASKKDDLVIKDKYNPHKYVDYTETNLSGSTRSTRYYQGAWKPITQKFITEYTDNGYMKVIFGAGNTYLTLPTGLSTFGEYQASKIINNDMLGVLPKEGWTMFILYRVGGGISTNLGPGSINKLTVANVDWNNVSGTDGTKKGSIINSMKVTNISTALAGKDEPSTEEIKYLMKYNTASQNRAVTVNDYKVKLMQMPPVYGAPFRSSVIETNNKIEMSMLGLDGDGKLTSELPQTLVDNVEEYMKHYKNVNDYIEIKSGRIYNLGVAVDVFVDKNYNVPNVITNIIDTITSYFDVSTHDMGEDIFVGDLEKEITLLDGVISLIGFKTYSITGGTYSTDINPLPTVVEGEVCDVSTDSTFVPNDKNAEAKQINLNEIDRVLYSDYNSMYEIKFPESDIRVRVKTI